MLILLSTCVFELAVKSLRSAYFPTDEDVFQQLEKDPLVKRRLEEAASGELQAGWDRRTNKDRDQEVRVREVVERMKKAEEDRREGEVRELIRLRVESGEGKGCGVAEGKADGKEVNRMFSRGYGDVKMS